MSLFVNRVYSGLVVIGALVALAFLLNEGRSTPIVLLILFVGWVLLPFVGLLLAMRLSKRWPPSLRTVLFWLMPVIVGSSLAAYGGLFTSPQTRPAAIFLMVPLASWVLMGVIIPTTLLLSRRRP